MSSGPSGLHVSCNSATPVIVVDPDQPDPTALDTAAEILRTGRAGRVRDRDESTAWERSPPVRQAVSRIFAAKERPARSAVIVHVAGTAQARDKEMTGEWPATAQSLSGQYGQSLTLVLTRSRIIPDQVTAGHDTVGVRAPAGNVLARTHRTDEDPPIAAPSTPNRAGRISPTRAEHVLARSRRSNRPHHRQRAD